MIFLDTSVLIATAFVTHQHHQPSCRLWERCAVESAVVSTHTIAELYSTLTAIPPAARVTPRDAVLVVETFLKRLTAIPLSTQEYVETLQRTANLGHSGGMIYDALHLACARKVSADQIYTWNVSHFRRIAPDLAARIVTP